MYYTFWDRVCIKWNRFASNSLFTFLKTAFKFRKQLSQYRRWDYYGLFSMMSAMAEDMAKSHTNGHLERSSKTERELKVFSALMKRASGDNDNPDVEYIKTPNAPFKYRIKNKYEMSPRYGTKEYFNIRNSVRKHELEYAAKLLARRGHSWWD